MVTLVEVWYAALHSPLGYVVAARDRVTLMSRLYAERQRLADPDLKTISIFHSPFVPNELWLVRQDRTGETQG